MARPPNHVLPRRSFRRRAAGLSAVSGPLQQLASGMASSTPRAVEVAWAAAVGRGISLRSRPFRQEGRTLFVAVGDVAWQRELQGMTRRVLARLRSVLGASAPSRLEVLVDPALAPPAPAPEIAAPVAERAPDVAAPGAERIADPALRAAFARAHAAALRRRTP
jgi:hypothetical protein